MIGEDRYRKTEAISDRFSAAVATKMSAVSSDVCYIDDLLARENADDLATDFFQRSGRTSIKDHTKVEIEWCGAPYAAPPRCEHLCAHAFLYGQTRDDLAEDGVREIADAVRTRLNMVLGSSGRATAAPLNELRGHGYSREPRLLVARGTLLHLHCRARAASVAALCAVDLGRGLGFYDSQRRQYIYVPNLEDFDRRGGIVTAWTDVRLHEARVSTVQIHRSLVGEACVRILS